MGKSQKEEHEEEKEDEDEEKTHSRYNILPLHKSVSQ
jgi:hypothetical protein